MCRLFLVAFAIALSVVLSSNTLGQQTESSNVKCPNTASVIESQWDTVKAGETVKFEIRQPDGKLDMGDYIWEVSNGTIVSGQQTNQILVSASPIDSELLKPVFIWVGDEEHGYFLRGPSEQRVPLKVSANSISRAGCVDASLKLDIRIGKNSVAVNKPSDVVELSLTPAGELSIIEISTRAYDPENDPLTYNYTVTGGKIVGSGASVKWDLSGVAPGTYTITAGVDDGCGVCGKTVTKTLRIE